MYGILFSKIRVEIPSFKFRIMLIEQLILGEANLIFMKQACLTVNYCIQTLSLVGDRGFFLVHQTLLDFSFYLQGQSSQYNYIPNQVTSLKAEYGPWRP
jgi:hypothetical protein